MYPGIYDMERPLVCASGTAGRDRTVHLRITPDEVVRRARRTRPLGHLASASLIQGPLVLLPVARNEPSAE